MLVPFFTSIFISLLSALFLIRYLHLHQKLTGDVDSQGPQKFHIGLTPRIGGIPILLGLCCGGAIAVFKGVASGEFATSLLAAAIPVFISGLAEDIIKNIAPLWRLLASFLSAILAAWLLGAVLPGIGVPFVDFFFLHYPLVALVFTVVAVGGLCHSFNIIDGYNGLASGVGGMVLLSLGYVSFEVGDYQLLAVSLVSAGAVAGFMVWNFPRGLIFAGDGGAYLLGFLIGEISVLLVARNPSVSPWFPFTLVMYPVWETVFSVYRRRVVRGHAAGLPDALHLHQIVFSRLVRWMVGRREALHLLRRNSMTAPYLWGVGLLTVVPAVLLWQTPAALQTCCVAFALFYSWFYKRLVHFRAPRWMVLHRVNNK